MKYQEFQQFLGPMQNYVKSGEAFLRHLKLKRLVKLDKNDSSLDGITLYEKPDIEAIEKIIKV